MAVDVLLLGAELVGVSALALTAVGGTGRQTRVAFAAVEEVNVSIESAEIVVSQRVCRDWISGSRLKAWC